MIDRSNWNEHFEKTYKTFHIKPGTLNKIQQKHTVYLHELETALDDLCWVVRKNNSSDPKLPPGVVLSGQTYDVFCETADGRLLKVVGRLYSSGDFQIITVLPGSKLSPQDIDYYLKEKELICYE
ncbi:hypothetical protein CN918_30965 [Priestia megaterium]|nr:hypothetical protein CN918_30965 [Priestia megaterium]